MIRKEVIQFRMGIKMLKTAIVLFFLFVGVVEIEAAQNNEPLPDVPLEYENKHMPKGWWTDPGVIEEGRAIYQGEKYGKNAGKGKEVNCAKCHGADGKPVVKSNPDLRDSGLINSMSDSYLIWRIAEGVPKTKMGSFKGRLTEEDIWKVIAYFHTFSHGGKAEVHDHPELNKK